MLKLKLQTFCHLIRRTDSFEKTLMLERLKMGREGEQRMSWLDGITDSMDMNLSKLWETVEDRRAWCCSPRGHTKLHMTERLNNNNHQDVKFALMGSSLLGEMEEYA